jgi:TonB family protein
MLKAVRRDYKFKKEIAAFAASFFLHVFLAMIFIFTNTITKDKPDEVSIDIVTMHKFDSDSKNTELIPQQKVRKDLVKKITSTAPSAMRESKKHGSDKETLKPHVPIGASDIESSLHGRAPRNETEKYLVSVRDQVARQQTYPAPSRAFREQGTVKIRITLNRSGSVIKIELMEESPYKRLNDAAMKAATRAAPFGPFPDEVKFETWKITLPIRFTLAQI